jgi:hypothetical protein
MKENQKRINEAFFQKAKSYVEKMRGNLPKYEPQDASVKGQPGFGSIVDTNKGFAVTDAREAQKRIISTFQAATTINSVKNMASRSVKSFPIIISDNIEPETSVMLKRLMEEQYAEYINLLVSNQVVDLSAYKPGEEANIALQILDKVSADESKERLGAKMRKGEFSSDEYFASMYPTYDLIRQESKQYRSGNQVLDKLLEDAIILKTSDQEHINVLAEFYSDFANDLVYLSEDNTKRPTDLKVPEQEDAKYSRLGDVLLNQVRNNQVSSDDIKKRDKVLNVLSGYDEDAKREKILSPDIIVNNDKLDESVKSSLGEILLHPKNEALRDRFEKATFLLQANKITGDEYIDYLTERLGIPVSSSVRRKLVTQFRVDTLDDATRKALGQVRNRRIKIDLKNPNAFDPNKYYNYRETGIYKENLRRLENNENLLADYAPSILSVAGKSIINATLMSVAGAAIGGSVGLGSAAGFATAIFSGGLAAILAPAVVGGAAIGLSTYALGTIVKRVLTKKAPTSIYGWERVEALIIMMERQQRQVISAYEAGRETEKVQDEFASPTIQSLTFYRSLQKRQVISAYEAGRETEKVQDEFASPEELNVAYNRHKTLMEKIEKSSRPKEEAALVFEAVDLTDDVNNKDLIDLSERFAIDIMSDKEYQATILTESSKISTTVPHKLVVKHESDPKAKPEVMVVTPFTTRSTYAYAEVEYDKRELKDRKYNSPLIMTIKFRERFSDGTFSDNELTAVIGILGVINRVPSEEMEHILTSNVQNKTLDGIFKADKSPSNKDVADIFSIGKIQKDVDKLQYSAKVWQDLEKVKIRSMTNKLTGKESDNVANAHIIFSQKEIDNVKADIDVDYLRDKKYALNLMTRYSAFTLMIANDVAERLYVFDNPENINWDVVPYSALRNKDTGEQLQATLLHLKNRL